MDKHERKLGQLLSEVANWTWEEFGRAERDMSYSTSDSIIFSLIRSCAMENIGAIKLAINRVDGKLVTPIQVIYPKIYFLFPNAKTIAKPQEPERLAYNKEDEVDSDAPTDIAIREPIEGEQTKESDLPTLGFRQTMDKMIDYPRSLPKQIIKQAQLVDRYLAGQGEMPPGTIPSVKSVVTAHLLQMAQRRDIDALYEVFDSIDGKLTETLKVVGDDIYITQFGSVAPVGAIKNEEGVYQIEAVNAQRLWRQKLGGSDE